MLSSTFVRFNGVKVKLGGLCNGQSPGSLKKMNLKMKNLRDAAYNKEPADLAKALGADLEKGLSTQEAAARLAKNGPNEIQSAPPTPAWRRVLAQFQDPLIYLLLIAIVVALVAWGVEGWVGWPVDAIVIAIVVILNGALGYLEEAKARNAVAALARMTEAISSVMRNGHLVRLPSAQLVTGDLLVLAEGDSVGADARLIQVASLRVQEASLTGESKAVLKDVATLSAAAALGDQLNMVFKGTALAQGTGRAVVTATAMATERAGDHRGGVKKAQKLMKN